MKELRFIDLFAGMGGIRLGLVQACADAGINTTCVFTSEIKQSAIEVYHQNHPDDTITGDITAVDAASIPDFDILLAGFPCQAFSYAGKKGGLNDTRGTLFFELARAVKEIQPKVFMGENVKGLLSHDNGKTLEVIRNAIAELGYTLVEPRVLKAIMYQVPQKRERLILIAIRNDIYKQGFRFRWPDPYRRVMTLRDAFFSGELFENDVPESEGQLYPAKKARVMAMVPEGGDWRDLPVEEQKE